MTKETIEDYMPFIEALRAGKAVEWTDYANPDPDSDWREIDGTITFIRPPQNYRIKPEPAMIPLGPEDVPLGSIIRRSGMGAQQMIIGLCSDGDFETVNQFHSLSSMMRDGYEIKRPGEDWKPCCKPANE